MSLIFCTYVLLNIMLQRLKKAFILGRPCALSVNQITAYNAIVHIKKTQQVTRDANSNRNNCPARYRCRLVHDATFLKVVKTAYAMFLYTT